jgi:hypothetical protein
MKTPNSTFKLLELLTSMALFVITLVGLICSTTELVNKSFAEWMHLNKLLFKIVVLQILSCGAIGYCFDLTGSQLTASVKLAEHVLRCL